MTYTITIVKTVLNPKRMRKPKKARRTTVNLRGHHMAPNL
jgi:hypothetical protein